MIENEENQTEEVKEKGNFEFEVVNELVDNMPEVSEHIINDEMKETENTPIPAKIEDDGKTFNPDVHCATKDGQPVLTKNGAFRKKSGRTKANQSTIGGSVKQGGNIQAENSPIPDKSVIARATAEEIDLLYWSGMNVAFPTPINQQLQVKASPMAVNALTRGFEQMEQVPTLHWSVSVAMIYLGATMAILNQPESKSTIQKIKDKVILFFAKRQIGQSERKG